MKLKVIALLLVGILTGTARPVGEATNIAALPDEETLKSNLARLVQSPIIKNDGYVAATSIEVESVGPFFPSGNNGEVSFVVRWTSPQRFGNPFFGPQSGKWRATIAKAANGRWYITEVAVFSGEHLLKGISPDFEIRLLESPGRTEVPPTPQPLNTTEEPAKQTTPNDSVPNLASLKDVCPGGSVGEFRHGTKCVGYYDTAQADRKLILIDIQVAGRPSAKSYTKTKSLVHAGVDIVAPEGSEIRPIADGTVDDAIVSRNDENFGTLGYMVIVEHSEKSGDKPVYILYLHMKEKPKVAVGQTVKAGETVLGLIGSTGAAFGSHVHVEVRRFPGRFFPKWKNIYGIERPSDEATFEATEFAENWVDPEAGSIQGFQQSARGVENQKANKRLNEANTPANPNGSAISEAGSWPEQRVKLRQDLEEQLRELMARPSRPPDEPDKVLADDKQGVTVSYPAEWEVSRQKHPVVAFFVAPKDDASSEQTRAKISVTCARTPLLNRNPSLNLVVNDTIAGTKAALAAATITGPFKTTLAGAEAEIFIANGMEAGMAQKKAVTVAVCRKHILGVVLHATPETFPNFWDAYRRVCESYVLH